MGIIGTIASPILEHTRGLSLPVFIVASLAAFLLLAVVFNILSQLLLKNPNEPPVVFHIFPFVGSTITYGIDPYKFFFSCREKYGNIFTFILLGKKTTVFLGTRGNDFIFNGKLEDVNAEEVYTALCTPVFGSDVVYDCPNSKLMEQKKVGNPFVKFGLSTAAFRSYVPLIVNETTQFLENSKFFKDQDSGRVDIAAAMAELTIYTASRSLQGKEVRDRFDSRFAELYHDLDMGFSPINFMLPSFPFPHNKRRDNANKKMTETYAEIIRDRKEGGNKKDSEDMIWNLMQCVYKDGTPVPDHEVAHMMIAMLMAGQHSSSSTIAWILIRLAQNPHITEELLEEQLRELGPDLPPLTYENLQLLTLNSQVVKETLRMHAPIHSMIRRVKSPLPLEGTPWTVPTTHNILAAPGVTANSSEFFPVPQKWNPHRWDTASTNVKDEDEEKIDYGYGMVSKGASSPYLPFGAGRHRCIGEQFAYLQLGTILATFVRYMKVYNVDGRTEVVGTDYSSLFSRPLRPATVGWERRRGAKVEEKKE